MLQALGLSIINTTKKLGDATSFLHAQKYDDLPNTEDVRIPEFLYIM